MDPISNYFYIVYLTMQLGLYIINTIYNITVYVCTLHMYTLYVRKLVSACWLASLENAANGATYVEAALHQG